MKRSSPSPSVKPDQNLQSIDDLCRKAGLVRNRRKSPPGVTTRVRAPRQDAATQQELVLAAPIPTVLRNNVNLLQVPAWRDRKSVSKWLWHGFSTRRGGTSRAYCGERDRGELNLGFTEADDREAVAQNRRLLAEAANYVRSAGHHWREEDKQKTQKTQESSVELVDQP